MKMLGRILACLLVIAAPAHAASTTAAVTNFPTITALKSAYPSGVGGVPSFVAITGGTAQTDGNGGQYWYNASDTTSGPSANIVVDNAGRRWYYFQTNISANAQFVNTKSYGAFCDGTAHLISSGDISAHPNWIGTYSVGTSWDTVGIQEAIYAAFATHSTPGNVVWNSLHANDVLNKTLFQPNGNCYVNQQLLIIASGLQIEFQSRSAATWVWHGSSSISMLFTNSISYGVIDNITLSSAVATVIGSAPLWDMDHTGSPAGLATQQLTINNAVIGVATLGSGISISASGGSAQGDTILFINPNFTAFAGNYALGIFGQNALSIILQGGDIQGFQQDAVANVGGSVYIYGTSFQNESTQLNETPVYSQVNNAGADLHIYAGSGPTGVNDMENVRSEGEVALNNSGYAALRNVEVAAAGNSDWFANYPFTIGTSMGGGGFVTVGSKAHTFEVVEDGGNVVWLSTPAQTATCSFTDNTQTWTTNQWANFAFSFEFENHFTQHNRITSNTANTLNFTSGDCPNVTAVAGDSYHIGGYSGGSAPSFDSAANGTSEIHPGTGQGVTTIPNSNNISVGGELYGATSVNDYLIIPGADLQPNTGASGSVNFPAALIAKVTAKNGCTTTCSITLNKNAAVAVTNGPWYQGTPITDNNLLEIDLNYGAIVDPEDATNVYMQSGNLNLQGDARNITTDGKSDYLQGINGDGILYTNNNLSASILSSAQSYIPAHPIDGSSPTVDLTSRIQEGNFVILTPEQNTVFNFPVPNGVSFQSFTIVITTTGVSSFNLTCGANARCQGALATGTVSGKKFVWSFLSDGTTWNEVSRTTAE